MALFSFQDRYSIRVPCVFYPRFPALIHPEGTVPQRSPSGRFAFPLFSRSLSHAIPFAIAPATQAVMGRSANPAMSCNSMVFFPISCCPGTLDRVGGESFLDRGFPTRPGRYYGSNKVAEWRRNRGHLDRAPPARPGLVLRLIQWPIQQPIPRLVWRPILWPLPWPVAWPASHIVRAGDQIPSCCRYLAAAWVRLSTPIFSKRFLRWNFTVLSEMSSSRAS